MDLRLIVQAIVSGLLTGGVYALMAVGLTLIFGMMKIINFAHGELLMLGMYTSYWLFTLYGVDPYISAFVSFGLLFCIGALVQRFLVQRVMDAPEINQLLLTMGLSVFLANLAALLFSPDYLTLKVSYATSTFSVGNIEISIPRLGAFISCMMITGFLYLFLQRTKLGKAMRAACQEREGSILVGIDVHRIYLIAFGIGSACAGAAGSLISTFFYVSPYVGSVFVLTAFIIVVLGTMGDFVGALIGGLIVGLVESLGAVILTDALKQLFIFILFICVLLFKPSGLFGKKAR